LFCSVNDHRRMPNRSSIGASSPYSSGSVVALEAWMTAIDAMPIGIVTLGSSSTHSVPGE
jgi:hypothetical protein